MRHACFRIIWLALTGYIFNCSYANLSGERYVTKKNVVMGKWSRMGLMAIFPAELECAMGTKIEKGGCEGNGCML